MHDKTQLNKISQKTQKEKQNSSPPQKKKIMETLFTIFKSNRRWG